MSTPAHDQRAEQSVLGAILHRPSALAELAYLKADHFYLPAHQLLYQTMQQMSLANEDIDSVTVFAKLAESKELRRVGGAPYLSDLLQSFKSADNVDSYARIVIDRWKIRRVNEIGTQLSSIDADADEVPLALEQARQFLDGAQADQESSSVDFPGLYEAWTKWNEDSSNAFPCPQ